LGEGPGKRLADEKPLKQEGGPERTMEKTNRASGKGLEKRSVKGGRLPRTGHGARKGG